jgi:hypothetical protein
MAKKTMYFFNDLGLTQGLVANGSIGTPGQALFSNGDIAYWDTITATSVVASGANTQLQFNDSGVFGATANLTFDKVTNYFYVNGRIGVGTASPAYKLHVVDNTTGVQARIDSSSSGGTSLSFNNTATNGRSYRIGSNFVTGTGEFAIYDDTASASRIFITSAGNVGAGTTSPYNARLHVAGNTTSPDLSSAVVSNASAVLGNSDPEYGTYFATYGGGGGAIQQRRGGSAVYYDLYLQPHGGNIGVGTTGPQSKLHVAGEIRHTSSLRSQGATYSSVWMQFDEHQFGNSLILGAGGMTAIGAGESANVIKTNIAADIETLFLSSDNGGTAEAFRFVSNTQSGVWADRVEAMTILGGGNVGIGTITPGYKLDVNGDARFGSGTPGLVGRVNAVGSGGTYVSATYTTPSPNITTFMGGDSSNYGMVGTFSAHDFVIRSNNTARATFPSGGGGMTLSGSRPIQISTNDGALFITADSGGWSMGTYYKGSSGTIRAGFGALGSADALTYAWIGTGHTNAWMTFLGSGNVGIGTTNPTHKLHLYEGGSSDVVFRLTAGNGTYDPLIQFTGQGNDINAEGFEIWYDNDVGDVHLSTTYPNDAATIHFHTRTGGSKSTANERLTILGNGNVGVGITTPGAKLTVSGEVRISSSGAINTHLNYLDGGDNYISMGNAGATYFRNSSATLMTILGGGNVGINTSPVTKLHVNEGKILVRSTTSNWGQLQVANPNEAEASITIAASGTGSPGVDSTYLFQWVMGINPFGTGTTNFAITNRTLGADAPIKISNAGQTTFTTTSDAQIVLNGAGTSWAGIQFTDVDATDYLFYRGSNGTFSIGGGGSNIPGKKLHINGGVSIGSGYSFAYPPSEGLTVQGPIISNSIIYSGVVTSGGLASGQWYTIAAESGARASASFIIVDQTSGLHQAIHFNAAVHFGTTGTITVVSNSYYGGPPIQYIRLKQGGTYDGAVLQVYIGTSCSGVSVYMVDNFQNGNGWNLVNWTNDSLNPGVVSNWGALTERVRTKTDRNGYLMNTNGIGIGFDSNTRLVQGNGQALRVQTDSGYIEMGPQNPSYGHIYTDRGNFYLNVYDLYLNGNLVPAYGYNRSGNLYASIYYDSESPSSYYIDPNNISQMYQARFINRIAIGNDSVPYLNTGTAGLWISNGGGASHFFGSHDSDISRLGMYTNGAWRVYVNSAGDWVVQDGEICNSNYSQGNMQGGALNIGRTDRDYAWDGTTWASDIRVGILANCSETWEFAVHDSGDAVKSIFHYNGSGIITLGRAFSWGTSDISIANRIYFGTTNNGFAEPWNTYSSSLRKISYMSFDWNGNYDSYSNHGISSTDSSGSFTDSMSINSYNDINLRIDSNNNNGDSYVRFHNNSSGSNQFAYFGYDGSNYVGHIEGTMRSQIFRISSDTTSRWEANYMVLRGGSPTVYFRDTDHYVAMLHCNSNLFYLLRANSADTESWTTTGTNGNWPVYWDLTNNDMYAGRDIYGYTFYARASTGYYLDPDATSRLGTVNADLLRSYNNVYTDGNYGHGLVGLYSAARLQGVFAMGDSYKLSADGTSAGSLYGIAWSHPNAGGTAGNLASHGMLILENGGFRGAWGGGRLVTTSDIRGTIFYDYDNTGYYCDPSSTSYLYHLILSGASYFRPQNWIQMDGSYGMYWPNTNGAHLEGNTLSSYGSIAIRGSRNGWRGIYFYDGGSAPHLMFDGSSNGGIYYESGGRWASYYSYGNDCWGIGTSSTSSTYGIYSNKGAYYGGRVDGTIFYDSNNTGYYLDPNSTTALRTVGSWRADSADWDGEFSGKIQYHSSYWYFQAYNGWLFRNSGGTNVVSIDSSGNFVAAGNVTAYGSPSDIKLKENVIKIDNALDKVHQLNGYYYNYIGKTDKLIGVIAQEVEKVVPELVYEYVDPTNEKQESSKAVRYELLTSLLIEAIKEQTDIINSLKKELTELKAKLEK